VGEYEGAGIVKYSWDLDGDGSEDWASPTTGHYMKAFNQYTEAIFCIYGDDGAFACDTVAIVICPEEMALVKEGPFCVDRFEYPNRRGEAVRTGVTAQQAQQLCAESGKRLCSAKQWRMACSAEPKDEYPYGRRFVQDNCNTLGNAIIRNEVAGAGYFQSCKSPIDIYDMSGNVAEWVAEEGGAGFVYGGSYQQGPQQTTCNSSIALDAKKSYFYVGFRCCK
jgi:formylglycine-generating enzyme required for sulfatase activity